MVFLSTLSDVAAKEEKVSSLLEVRRLEIGWSFIYIVHVESIVLAIASGTVIIPA